VKRLSRGVHVVDEEEAKSPYETRRARVGKDTLGAATIRAASGALAPSRIFQREDVENGKFEVPPEPLGELKGGGKPAHDLPFRRRGDGDKGMYVFARQPFLAVCPKEEGEKEAEEVGISPSLPGVDELSDEPYVEESTPLVAEGLVGAKPKPRAIRTGLPFSPPEGKTAVRAPISGRNLDLLQTRTANKGLEFVQGTGKEGSPRTGQGTPADKAARGGRGHIRGRQDRPRFRRFGAISGKQGEK